MKVFLNNIILFCFWGFLQTVITFYGVALFPDEDLTIGGLNVKNWVDTGSVIGNVIMIITLMWLCLKTLKLMKV